MARGKVKGAMEDSAGEGPQEWEGPRGRGHGRGGGGW